MTDLTPHRDDKEHAEVHEKNRPVDGDIEEGEESSDESDEDSFRSRVPSTTKSASVDAVGSREPSEGVGVAGEGRLRERTLLVAIWPGVELAREVEGRLTRT